jgi:hypothetical protein
MTTNHPKDKSVGRKTIEDGLLLLLDDFLERADGLRIQDLDLKDAFNRIVEDPAIEFESVRHVESVGFVE